MEYWTCDIAGPNRKFRNGDEFLDYLKEDDKQFENYFEEWLNWYMGAFELLRAVEDDGRNTSYFMNQFENEIRRLLDGHHSESFRYFTLDFVFTKGDDGKASDKTASKKASKPTKPKTVKKTAPAKKAPVSKTASKNLKSAIGKRPLRKAPAKKVTPRRK